MIRPRVVWAILEKDLLRYIANRALLLVLLLFVGLALLVSGSETFSDTVTYQVLVPATVESTFIDRFFAEHPRYERVVVPYMSMALRRLVAAPEKLILDVPLPDFDELLSRRLHPRIEIHAFEVNRMAAEALAEALLSAAYRVVEPTPPLQVEIRTERRGEGSHPVGNAQRSAFPSAPRHLQTFVIAGLLTLAFNVIGFNLLVTLFSEEKEKRTLLAQMIAPVQRGEVLFAKFLFSFTLSGTLAGVIVLIHAPRVLGNPLFLPLVATATLAYVSIATTIVSLTRRQTTASLTALGYLFLLAALFLLAPQLSGARYLVRLFPENYLYQILLRLFSGPPIRFDTPLFLRFLAVTLLLTIVALLLQRRGRLS
ncbi:MAG: hypothetical protein D6812_00485 [Deltaproteobacteria bacterium]|nr:MAG: hypothetical protein D6812_00485 [Deltaproteobacteria bacterium]